MDFMFSSWFSQKFEGLRSRFSPSIPPNNFAVKVEESDNSQPKLSMSSLLCKRNFESKGSTSSSPLSRKKVKIEHLAEHEHVHKPLTAEQSTLSSEPHSLSSLSILSMDVKEIVERFGISTEVQNESLEKQVDLGEKDQDHSIEYEEESQEKLQSDFEVPNVAKRFEERVVLKIFEGDLISNFRKESEKIPCSFYSCEKFSDLRVIEEFQSEVTISGKVKEYDAILFIKGKRENPASSKNLLVGWVSTEASYQSCLKELASYLRAKNRCASIRRPDSSIIYLLPPQTVDKEMREELDWNPVTPDGHAALEPILFFAVYVRNPEKCTSISCVTPEFVGVALGN